MTPRTRNRLLFAVKVVVAATLLTWLIRSGSLDMSALGILFQRPSLLALNIAVFAAGLVLGTLRWGALLRLAGVIVPFRRLLQLHYSALFFNVVIPGNVGGDVIKALYVARDAPPEKRPVILLIVFIDRLMGLAGLVTLATLITVIRGPILWNNPVLRPMAGLVALLGVGVLVGPAILVLVMRRAGNRIATWTSGTSRISKLLAQLVASMRLLSSQPRLLALALVLSMGIHFAGMSLFTVLTRAIVDPNVGISEIATIYPLGILSLVLPISPSGLGVGHVAFDRLFKTIGLTGGASVFNVYLLAQIVPCLLGFFPYLALKREPVIALPAETET
jgi:uncharacterized protein (TIRG00374 family)